MMKKRRLARRIRRSREDRNMSVVELSHLTNIDVETIENYESAKQEIHSDHLTTLRAILHLRQHDEHEVHKRHRPIHIGHCVSMYQFDSSPTETFFAWCKSGFRKLKHDVRKNRLLRASMGLLLLAFVLSYLADQITIEILTASAIFPVGLMLILFINTEERTISSVMVLKMFIVGGLWSILIVLLIYDFVGTSDSFGGNIVVAFTEEAAKIILVIYYLNRLNVTTVKAGMLVGFVVGAGFDVFETAQYGTIMFLETLNYGDVYGVLFLRGGFALLGIGHHFWTAMLAGTLVYTSKKTKRYARNATSPVFVQAFIVVVLIHATWNWTSLTQPLIVSSMVALFSLSVFLLMYRMSSHEAMYNQHSIQVL